MARRRLLWQLYPSFLLITLVSVIAVAGYSSRAFRHFYLEDTAEDLQARAALVESQISGLIADQQYDRVDHACKLLGGRSATRITVILPSGLVIGDTEEDPQRMDNHANRPEVLAARNSGNLGTSTRYSNTVKKRMMYVAVPLYESGELVAVVRTSIPVTWIDATIRSMYLRLLIGGLVVIGMVALVSLLVSRRISYPLEELKLGAQRFARGELDKSLPVPDSEEIGELAEAMNVMAQELDNRLRTVINQRNEQEAVLSSMIEGVLAVDNEQRLININNAAADLFEVDTRESQGRKVENLIDNRPLINFIQKVLVDHEQSEDELEFHGIQTRYLRVHGNSLRDSKGNHIGALVVLHDVTRLRELEQLRKEFVANVSHELKTPITSIKGFVETLLDGAMNDPEDSKRFLVIIIKHAERLNQIIEDLLSLSRIEQEAQMTDISLNEENLQRVLSSAITFTEIKAREKDIKVKLNCPDDLVARINAPLLEQAIINLLDNAIKYSNQEGEVELAASRNGDETIISVRDRGCGIEEEHLPRLFERFYRVDKARSRRLGGTGLGLAIVKHISHYHGGKVGVKSSPGKGSIFSIHLPVNQQSLALRSV